MIVKNKFQNSPPEIKFSGGEEKSTNYLLTARKDEAYCEITF